MQDEIQDLRKRIHRLEDSMLRCKNYQEQLRMKTVLDSWRRKILFLCKSRNGQLPLGE